MISNKQTFYLIFKNKNIKTYDKMVVDENESICSQKLHIDLNRLREKLGQEIYLGNAYLYLIYSTPASIRFSLIQEKISESLILALSTEYEIVNSIIDNINNIIKWEN